MQEAGYLQLKLVRDVVKDINESKNFNWNDVLRSGPMGEMISSLGEIIEIDPKIKTAKVIYVNPLLSEILALRPEPRGSGFMIKCPNEKLVIYGQLRDNSQRKIELRSDWIRVYNPSFRYFNDEQLLRLGYELARLLKWTIVSLEIEFSNIHRKKALCFKTSGNRDIPSEYQVDSNLARVIDGPTKANRFIAILLSFEKRFGPGTFPIGG